MRNLPKVTKWLLIANLVFFVLTASLSKNHIDLADYLGLHFVTANTFHFWQPITYMFMHANFSHLFFNMFAVLMFAPMIEREFGTRRFATYYFVCGLGAALVQEIVWACMGYPAGLLPLLNTVGASGAVFGILFAFAWLFPDVPMFILFIPIPIRARVFVLLYAGIELLEGLQSVTGHNMDNVAHFAHLGGFIFGWLIILYWKHINWREPRWGEYWDRFKGLFRSHRRLDSSKDNDMDNYHYHRRL